MTRRGQSRLMSFSESVVNVAFGYWIAVGTQIIVFPLFGIQTSFADDLKIGALFTVVSIARSYALRRLFEAIHCWGMSHDLRNVPRQR